MAHPNHYNEPQDTYAYAGVSDERGPIAHVYARVPDAYGPPNIPPLQYAEHNGPSAGPSSLNNSQFLPRNTLPQGAKDRQSLQQRMPGFRMQAQASYQPTHPRPYQPSYQAPYQPPMDNGSRNPSSTDSSQYPAPNMANSIPAARNDVHMKSAVKPLQNVTILDQLPAMGLSEKREICFAVMGVTGVGKSKFVQDCTGQETDVNDGLESGTSRCKEYFWEVDPGLRVRFFDVPGFDDTNRSDAEILQDIAAFTGGKYKDRKLCHGILYLHRIFDTRVSGKQKQALDMFKAFCGDHYHQRIGLVTTHWDIMDPARCEDHHKNLVSNSKFWGELKNGGATVDHRYYGNKRSARYIVRTMIARLDKISSVPEATQFQREFIVQQLPLNATSAGQRLDQYHQEELKALKEKVKLSKTKSEVNANVKEFEEKMQDSKSLNVNYEQLKKKDLDKLFRTSSDFESGKYRAKERARIRDKLRGMVEDVFYRGADWLGAMMLALGSRYHPDKGLRDLVYELNSRHGHRLITPKRTSVVSS